MLWRLEYLHILITTNVLHKEKPQLIIYAVVYGSCVRCSKQSAWFDVIQLLRIEEELGNVRYAGESFRKPL